MNTESFQVSESLYLVRCSIKEAPKTPATPPPAHYVFVIDCSGSMSADLPKIRAQIKTKIPTMLRPGDQVSAVWFSGKGEFGSVLEAFTVDTLKDVKAVAETVDRWLRPIGLTGFKEPLDHAAEVLARSRASAPDMSQVLVFMSDGCDNQWPRAQVLAAADKLAPLADAVTVVEYGYFADRALLTSIAERTGGALVFAEDFPKYEPVVEAAIKKCSPSKLVNIELPNVEVIGGFVFSADDASRELLTFEAKHAADGTLGAAVRESAPSVYFLSTSKVGSDWSGPDGVLCGLYGALSLFAARSDAKVIWPILAHLGDIHFVDQWSGLFGKQAYTRFMLEAKDAAFDAKKRMAKGYDPMRVPAEDAPCVMQLLSILGEDDGNRVLLDHQGFRYSKISRSYVQADDALSDEDEAELTRLQTLLVVEKSASKKRALSDQISKILAKHSQDDVLRFIADPAPDGYAFDALVWNEDRPNVSFRVRKEGAVDISKKLANTDFAGKIPSGFRTHVYRNYALVRDGLVNVAELPVKLTEATYQRILKEGFKDIATFIGKDTVNPSSWGTGVYVMLSLDKLPVMNRAMARAVSAKDMFELQYKLEKARAAQKVFKYYREQHFPARIAAFDSLYGKDGADFLTGLGFGTNGFAPPRVAAPARDFYMGKELSISIKGLSSLPPVKDVAQRRLVGKGQTTAGALMEPYVGEVDTFLAQNKIGLKKERDKKFEAWLAAKSTAAIAEARHLLAHIAQTKFGVVVGQTWFWDLGSIENDSMDIEVEGKKLACKVEMKEIEVYV